MNIYVTRRGIFCTVRGRPVTVRQKRARIVILCVFDVAAMLGVPATRVTMAADTDSTIQSKRCKSVVRLSWSTEEELRVLFPDAIWTVSQPPPLPRPCTIHYRTSGQYARQEDVDMRTITATCDYLRLTRRRFEAIVSRAPGYRSFLDTAVRGITVRPAGWVPPSGVFFNPLTRNPEPLWELKTLANGEHELTLIDGHPQIFQNISDIPECIRMSMRLA